MSSPSVFAHMVYDSTPKKETISFQMKVTNRDYYLSLLGVPIPNVQIVHERTLA